MKQECPICHAQDLELIWSLDNAPTIVNQVYETPQQAQKVKRSVLHFVLCRACQFVFNQAFESSAIVYDSDYDNHQAYSSTFLAHMQAMANKIAAQSRLQGKIIVEVGCGKGDFLKLIVEHQAAHIIGYDTAYEGDLHPTPTLEFRQRYLTPEEKVDCDILVSRHVIEHIEYPRQFLQTITQSLPQDKPVEIYFETPSIEWILQNLTFWDFLYEHCSFFSVHSLAKVFALASYSPQNLDKVFGDQYLMIKAVKYPVDSPASEDLAPPMEQLGEKLEKMRKALARWKEQITSLARQGKVWLWGAGGKGVSFVSHLGEAGIYLAGIIDINPNKKNKYIASGHQVMSPADAVNGVKKKGGG